MLSLKSSCSGIPFAPLSPDLKPDLESCPTYRFWSSCHLISLIGHVFCSNFLPGFFPVDIYTHRLFPYTASYFHDFGCLLIESLQSLSRMGLETHAFCLKKIDCGAGSNPESQ